VVTDGHWLDVVDMPCDCRVWPVPLAVAFQRGRCGRCGKNPTTVVGEPYRVWVPDSTRGEE
jgi:hypothetical protein